MRQATGKSTREVAKMLADVDPALAVPTDRVQLGRWQLTAVIDAECERGLKQLRGLLSHGDPHMTLWQLVGRLVGEGLDRHDRGRPPRRARTRSAPTGAGRPPAPKRKASSSGAATSAPNRSAMHAPSTTSAPKSPSGSARGDTSPAHRSAQAASASRSRVNPQLNADPQATSAAKRMDRTVPLDVSPPTHSSVVGHRGPGGRDQEHEHQLAVAEGLVVDGDADDRITSLPFRRFRDALQGLLARVPKLGLVVRRAAADEFLKAAKEVLERVGVDDRLSRDDAVVVAVCACLRSWEWWSDS